jgi:O-antigen/teichoic acid export membrane protein
VLIRHSILYTVAKIVPGLLGMATTAILTRLLDPRQYGSYGLALLIMTFGSTMAFDWLGVTYLRFYQGRRDDPRMIGTFVPIFMALVGLTAAVAGAGWTLGLFAGIDGRLAATGIVMMWCYAWFELAARFEIAGFRPMRYLTMNVCRGLFTLVGAAGTAYVTRDAIDAAAGMAVGTFLGASLCGVRVWRCSLAGIDWRLAGAVVAFGLPMAASMMMSGLVGGGTRSLVGWLDSPAALGFYTAAFTLVPSALVMLGAGVASASYSLAVQAVETGDADVARQQLLANCTLLLAVLSPAALGIALTAHGLAATLVGPDYVAMVAELTPWMAFGSFFGAFRGYYLDHAFQLGKRPFLQIWVTGLAALVALGLSAALIPRYGPLGAAMATAAAMVASSALAYILGRRAYPVPIAVGPALRILAASLVMVLAILAVPGSGRVALGMQITAGAVAYLIAAFALDVLDARSHVRRMILWRTRLPAGLS